jgi:hypothetical protein
LPNVFSVLADAIAGPVLATHVFKAAPAWGALALSCGASASLYLAGMAFNDIADVREDTRVRPNRPIPSGAVSWRGAIACACILMLVGIGLAALLSRAAFYFSLGVVAAILLYDFVAKGRFLFGPLALGLCRGLNMLMVISAVAGFDAAWARGYFWEPQWFAACASALYGAGVTAFSAQEETGQGRGALALGWLVMIPAFVCALVVFEGLWHPGAMERLGKGSEGPEPIWRVFFGIFFWCSLWVRLLLRTLDLARTKTTQAAQPLVLTGVQGYCYFDAAMLFLGAGASSALWACVLILFVYPGRYLRKWLEQKEA